MECSSISAWILGTVACVILRLLCWAKSRLRLRASPCKFPGRTGSVVTLVVLGSGGHTMEMIGLLREVDQSRYSCHFVIADTDTSSLKKLSALRPDLVADTNKLHIIPRSREVGQSLWSSVVSTFIASLSCLKLVWKIHPQVLFLNGPGTCVPIAFAALLLELLCFRIVAVIFVESFCRVQTLSVTGMLLYPVADLFVVHWAHLVDRYPKAQTCGVLL